MRVCLHCLCVYYVSTVSSEALPEDCLWPCVARPGLAVMALKNCYKCFTVSLVPVVALILAIVFAGGIIVLPVVYEEMTFHVKVQWE